jgi:hypothetical protein
MYNQYNKSELVKLVQNGEEVLAKKCKKCKETKPLHRFSNAKTCVGGVAGTCKQCKGLKETYKWTQLTTIEKDGSLVEAKKCTKCVEIKELNDFPNCAKDKKEPGGKKSFCKDCAKKQKQDYYKRNKERINANNRNWSKNNREKENEKGKRLREQNPEKYQLKDARRLARKKSLLSTIKNKEYEVLVREEFNSECAVSKERIKEITLEHFIPLSWGHGGTIKGNIYPMSASLNYSKQDENPFIWIEREDIKNSIDIQKWEKLLNYLSKCNKLTVEEFTEYVNWCYKNKRTVEEINETNVNSLNEWRKIKK